MIIATIVPNNYFMPFEAVKCWLRLPKKYKLHAEEGPSLPDNRNRVAAYAKVLDQDLLFIDSDIIFPIEYVTRMEKYLKTYDVVTGVYVIGKSYAFRPCLFSYIDGKYEKIPIPKEFSEIGACGGGFLAISKKALQVLGDDPFTNIWEENVEHGEDISFCQRIHESGLKLWCDPTLLLGHLRTRPVYPK